MADVQFSEKNHLKLIPEGAGFAAEDEMCELDSGATIRKINQIRSDFKASAKRRGAKLEGRRSRDEKQFISKANFILTHRSFTAFDDPEDVLLSLLADTSTLFSRSYQIYTANHEFYRGLRSQHGKTPADELRCCRSRALQTVKSPEQRRRYELILRRLEEKAAHEGRQVTELEPILVFQTGPFPGSISLPAVEAEDAEGVKRFLASPAGHSLLYNQHKAFIYGCAPDRLCGILHEWFPDIELKPAEEPSFALDVLWTYFAQARSIPAEKQAAGHYADSHRKIDKIHCKEYQNQKNSLKDVIQRYKKCSAADYEHIFEPDRIYEVYKTDHHLGKHPGNRTWFESICNATKEFLKSEENIAGGVENIIDCIGQSGVDALEFPFHYLMVIAAGKSALFRGARTLNGTKVMSFCSAPYDSKLPEYEQRIRRISCLHQLNMVCELDREARSENWNLFLTVHGTKIESKAELEMWQEILYGKASENTKKEPIEDIPAIELTLLCLECLQNCLSEEIETLYCYTNGSFMHQGGFAEFLKRHPQALNVCVERVQRKDVSADIQKYQAEWAKLDYDSAAIQKLCRKRAERIRWGNDFNQELEDFCRPFYQSEENTTKEPEQLEQRVSRSVQELKTLLVEAAFRKVLNHNAAKSLAAQAEKLLSREPYQIELTDLLQL